MRVSHIIGACLSLALTTIPAGSQTSATGAIRAHIHGIDIPEVPNAPFTAKVVVTWDQPLVGGGTVSRKYYTMVARDSQGRVHRETRGFVPANSNAEPELRSVVLLDPVSGTWTTCSSASMTCAVGAFHPRQLISADPRAAASGESLGTQTVDDLNVIGTRIRNTGTEGSNGSRRIALTSTEAWYSPDLQMDLSVIRKNPQLGQVTLLVTDLVRGEPDKSWFAVPSGFELKNTPNR